MRYNSKLPWPLVIMLKAVGAYMLIMACIGISSVLLTGCEKKRQATTDATPNRNELNPASKYYDQQVEEYNYQGCQYIVVKTPYSWGAHKGNCTNPIHQCK